MRIYIGNDHTAVEMKNFVLDWLKENGHDVINLGTDTNDSVDYPNYGFDVAEQVTKNPGSRGIVFCGSGIGISIAANKVHGAICALVYEKEAVELARKHNNANMMASGARFIAKEKALELVKVFLSTDFEGDRHERRVKKLLDK